MRFSRYQNHDNTAPPHHAQDPGPEDDGTPGLCILWLFRLIFYRPVSERWVLYLGTVCTCVASFAVFCPASAHVCVCIRVRVRARVRVRVRVRVQQVRPKTAVTFVMLIISKPCALRRLAR